MDTLMNTVDKVMATRTKIKYAHPIPDTVSSMLYAVTELGEAADAMLRRDRPQDSRTNSKEHALERELAQALYMLYTALGNPEEKWDYLSTEDMEIDYLDYFVYALTSLLDAIYIYRNGKNNVSVPFKLVDSIHCIRDMAKDLGYDMDAELESWLRELEARYDT